jgi:hypothetical protein
MFTEEKNYCLAGVMELFLTNKKPKKKGCIGSI